MLRAAFLWLSEQPRIFRFVRRNGLARTLASRFVAGETIDEAITALHDLNTSNLSAANAEQVDEPNSDTQSNDCTPIPRTLAGFAPGFFGLFRPQA